MRHDEMIFSGDVDGCISGRARGRLRAARHEPEYRFAGDHGRSAAARFLINAIAISLERAVPRIAARSHQRPGRPRKAGECARSRFTLSPISRAPAAHAALQRRAWDFKLDSRTQEWFDLAMSADLKKNIGSRRTSATSCAQLSAEDKPVATLKAWEEHGLLGTIHPELAEAQTGLRKPEQAREGPRRILFRRAAAAACSAVLYCTLGRLKSREASSAHAQFGLPCERGRGDCRSRAGGPERGERRWRTQNGTPKDAQLTSHRSVAS